MQLTLHPHAKINLGLFIKGKRADGYHLLETLLYPIKGLYDDLTLQLSEQEGCHMSLAGRELDGNPDDNLCVKAYNLLRESVGALPGVGIALHKRIPAGAGLGGGSADAAYTLRGLNQLCQLGLSQDDLVELAAKLGADVPFFIYGEPMLATGIGTELAAFPVEMEHEIRLFAQPIHSSTVAAYKALDYRLFDPSRSLREALAKPVEEWGAHLHNDLEVPVFAMYPELATIKAELYAHGALYAAMSGSGSAMFGIFSKKNEAAPA